MVGGKKNLDVCVIRGGAREGDFWKKSLTLKLRKSLSQGGEDRSYWGNRTLPLRSPQAWGRAESEKGEGMSVESEKTTGQSRLVLREEGGS